MCSVSAGHHSTSSGSSDPCVARSPVNAYTALVHAFVISRLDYCNSLLAGIGDSLIDQLQTVMRVAARLVLRKCKFDPISADIRDRLHWLPHPFKNRLQAGSSRLQVSPWYRSCIPHGDACTEINCSGPLPSSHDGAR